MKIRSGQDFFVDLAWNDPYTFMVIQQMHVRICYLYYGGPLFCAAYYNMQCVYPIQKGEATYKNFMI